MLTVLWPPAPCPLLTRPPTQAALMTVADSLKSPVVESEEMHSLQTQGGRGAGQQTRGGLDPEAED